LKQHLSSKWS